MKQHCLRLLLILLVSVSVNNISFSQTRQYVNAISVANLLVDDVSIDRMVQNCRFHNLTETASEEGYTVFEDNVGNTVRFKKTDNTEEGVNGKLIEVRTKDTLRTIDKILKENGFEKHGITYDRGSRLSNTLTRCTISTQGKTRILHYQKANM
ncbi:MAG: hypothetical protein K2G52_10920 [Muribaculaceae bacterium]|nr:hypothetical protein [Muribaculaceae bacterium]